MASVWLASHIGMGELRWAVGLEERADRPNPLLSSVGKSVGRFVVSVTSVIWKGHGKNRAVVTRPKKCEAAAFCFVLNVWF